MTVGVDVELMSMPRCESSSFLPVLLRRKGNVYVKKFIQEILKEKCEKQHSIHSSNIGFNSVQVRPTFTSFIASVRRNLAMHRSDTPFVIWQPIRRPCLLERVYKPICTPH